MIPRETVTVHRPPVVDQYGDPTATAEASATQDGCTVYPSGTSDPLLLGRTAMDSGLIVLGPAGWDVLHTDEMTVRGIRYKVTGLPFDWGPGVEVHLATRKG